MRKRQLTIGAAALVAVALMGTTWAAYTSSINTDHQVSTSNLSIKLLQDTSLQQKLLPGDETADAVCVENTGAEDCFVRIGVKRSWNQELDTNQIQLLSEGLEDGSWYVAEDKGEDTLYFYYRDILPSGEKTTNMLDSFSVLTTSENSNAYAEAVGKLEFEAEAVQAYDGAAAMLSEWGVVPQIEENILQSVVAVPTDQWAGEVTFRGNESAFAKAVETDTFTNLRPGETKVMHISLENEDTRARNFYIDGDVIRNLAAMGDQEAKYDFSISKDGEVLFEREIDGEETSLDLGDYISLGSMESGQVADIAVTLSLDGASTGNAYQMQEGELQLTFAVEDVPASNVPTKEPVKEVVKTGDAGVARYIILAGISLALMMVIALRKYLQRKGRMV